MLLYRLQRGRYSHRFDILSSLSLKPKACMAQAGSRVVITKQPSLKGSPRPLHTACCATSQHQRLRRSYARRWVMKGSLTDIPYRAFPRRPDDPCLSFRSWGPPQRIPRTALSRRIDISAPCRACPQTITFTPSNALTAQRLCPAMPDEERDTSLVSYVDHSPR
jgi:hypothetical protein